ncbi:MAG: ATP-binding protein [Alphaproteobacteria bacterium]
MRLNKLRRGSSAPDRRIPLRSRIAVRQAGCVVAAVCIVGLFLSLVQIVEDFFDHRAEIDRSAHQLLATVQQPAAQAAFMVDKPLAREVAAGLFAHDAVVEVTITTDFGEKLASIQRPTQQSSWLAEMLFSDRREFTLPLSVSQQAPTEVGMVTIAMDPLVVGEAFLVRAERTLIYGLLRAVVLSFLMALLFYHTLTKPLLTLIRSLGAVNPRRPDAVTIEVPKGHEHDEIGQLVEAANALLANLEKNRQRLQTSRSEAEKMRRRAEAASQAKTRFLATMSHELRTPLNAILGFSEMIRDEILGKVGTPQYRDYARDIHSSGRHLLHLISEILDISKIEAGKMELSPEDISLRELLAATVRVVELRAHENHLRLKIDLPDDLPTIHADEQAMKQVVLNLLSNAVKFTPAGGTITLTARVDASVATIEVADTGIGMSESELSRAFQPFEQADNRYHLAKDANGGTGLGLALVQRLVAMHEGEVSIASAPQQGTTVTIRLPLPERNRSAGTPAVAGPKSRKRSAEPDTSQHAAERQAA